MKIKKIIWDRSFDLSHYLCIQNIDILNTFFGNIIRTAPTMPHMIATIIGTRYSLVAAPARASMSADDAAIHTLNAATMQHRMPVNCITNDIFFRLMICSLLPFLLFIVIVFVICLTSKVQKNYFLIQKYERDDITHPFHYDNMQLKFITFTFQDSYFSTSDLGLILVNNLFGLLGSRSSTDMRSCG